MSTLFTLDSLEPEAELEVVAAKKHSGRRKIKIEFIDDKQRRQITFSKRKAGLMKKAYELTTLTGTQALLLVASETGHVYTFATPKLQPFVTVPEGKNLIQQCLNAPDATGQEDLDQPVDEGDGRAPNIISQISRVLGIAAQEQRPSELASAKEVEPTRTA